jgi:hypothetical protein
MDGITQSLVSHDDDGELTITSNLNLITILVNSTYTDLNHYVSDLIKSISVDSDFDDQQILTQIVPVTDGKSKNRRRIRKSVYQTKMLIKLYKKISDWDKDYIKTVASLTGLQYQQVYKWYWDQQQKNNEPRLATTYIQI